MDKCLNDVLLDLLGGTTRATERNLCKLRIDAIQVCVGGKG